MDTLCETCGDALDDTSALSLADHCCEGGGCRCHCRYSEAMQSHAGDSRCICTDGLEAFRDLMETCDQAIEPVAY